MPRKGAIRTPKRKVISINTSGYTRKGNPRNYFYLSECGHVTIRHHTAAQSIDMFMLSKNLEVTRVCRECNKGEPIVKSNLIDFFGITGLNLLKKLEKEGVTIVADMDELLKLRKASRDSDKARIKHE